MKSNYSEAKKYYLQFCELGDWEDLHYWFDTYEEAEKKFKELEKDYDKEKGFFGFIGEIKLCRSLDEDGKER